MENPAMAGAKLPSINLRLVEQVDSWPYFCADPDGYRRHMQNYHYFFIDGYEKPFGYVHNHFVAQMPWPWYWHLDPERRSLTLTAGSDFASRTRLMQETLRKGHESGAVAELSRLSAEDCPLYYSPTREHVLNMDGSGMDMFGIAAYSVHMIGWVMTADGRKIWVPRRAMTKRTFPGMLDSTVGGTLRVGERPIEGMVRECEEEICLDPEYTRANIRACGTASFQMTATDRLEPACQHQVQYLYEIELRQDVVPRIGDGEVGELKLMSVDEVHAAMARGEFKPSCLIIYLAFLIRLGYINAENEPHLEEICARLHRRHDFFVVSAGGGA